MVRVIINADDYAYDENRTLAILKAWRIGAITSTTALVNFERVEDCMQRAVDAGLGDRVGFHFNLTRGYPLTKAIRGSRLFCNSSGEFNGGFFRKTRLGRLWLPKFERNAIRDEFKAQAERFIVAGGRCMHFDSHHHVHNDLSVVSVILPLAVGMGFKSVRRPANLGDMTLCKMVAKTVVAGKIRRHLEFRTEFFGGFGDFARRLSQLPDGSSVEVMVHPMFGALESLDLGDALTDSGISMENRLEFLRRNSSVLVME
ncbi:MAG: ChbG/HpnK family deacetylase [Kiritimatiellae bacterium]|nr:ChbG/HpnK family deacetylase [Kiritimatiellia bacterium]